MGSAPISRFLAPMVWLVTLVATAAPVQAQSRGSLPQATVKQVLVREVGGAMEVEIQTSAPLAPDTQAIAGPDRIVIDFPGAVPSAQLRALKVNRGALKGVRSGLFFSDPPITRIVLDLTEAQAYQISNVGNATMVKLAGGAAAVQVPVVGRGARLKDASLASRGPHLSTANATVSGDGTFSRPQIAKVDAVPAVPAPATVPPAPVQPEPQAPPQTPAVSVTYENGMLTIHADKATLSQVLYEVHLRTQADIAIPAGAEQEQVIADLGPGPACDVLAQLLNGSAYNFIFVGDEGSLQRVILTPKQDGN